MILVFAVKMESVNALALGTALIAIISLSSVLASLKEMQQMKAANTQAVDIRPGAGRQEVVGTLDKFVCKFHYKAQGGTNEQWSMSIAANAGTKEWLCTVERPSGSSYLFFEEFKLEITGAHLRRAVLAGAPDVVLPDVEYLVNKKENSVQHSPGKFKSQLVKVQVYATAASKHKRDL